MSKKLMFLSKGNKSNRSTRGIDLGSSLKKLEVSDSKSNKKHNHHNIANKGNKEVASKSTKSNKELRRSIRYKRAVNKLNHRLISRFSHQAEANTIETNF